MISTERGVVLSLSSMSIRETGPWWPKLRTIISAALAALLLAGCGSFLRLGYGQGPHLAYWWADGYLDLDGEQSLRLREALDDWFDWHRRTQLPDYAALLARAQREVMQPSSPQAMCAWRFATSMHRSPVAPPTSHSVLNGLKSNFCAKASKLMRESPVIAPMNCSSFGCSA